MGYITPVQRFGNNSPQYLPNQPAVSRGLGHTVTNIPDVSQLEHLLRDQLISLLGTVGKLSNNSSCVLPKHLLCRQKAN